MNQDKSCRNCGHYITGGGCYQTNTQVKVDRDYLCIQYAAKGTPEYVGSVNHQQDVYEQRFDKDLPERYFVPEKIELEESA